VSRIVNRILLVRLQKLTADPRLERAVTTLIVFNAITLGLETMPIVAQNWGLALRLVDQAILVLFVVEIAVRMVAHRLAFFRDPWSVFDLLVVGMALVPATESLSVLRALRVLRVLRLVSRVPSLKRVVGGLIGALPGMGSIILLLGLVFYVFGVMATKLYGQQFPELFGNLPASLFTLFTIMTLEGWVEDVVKPVSEQFPSATFFFIPFIIGTTFTVLNLFIGIIVNAMQAEHEKLEAAQREAERDAAEAKSEPLLAQLKDLRTEIASLRREVTARHLPASSRSGDTMRGAAG
jgi:voltage-gated sodium channel